MDSESGLNRTMQRSVAPVWLEHDERWALVLRVAASQPFTKAGQLREILVYLSRRALSEPGASIREQEIGCNVLGRKPDFNPHEDNIVRVQISHLRKKLNEYFSGEGKDEPLQITIPKGTYIPRFEPKPQAAAEASPGAGAGERPAWYQRAAAYPVIWKGASLLLLGIAIGAAAVAVLRAPQKQAVDPVLREAWSPFASPSADVLLSTATPLNLEMAPEGYQAYGTPTYPAPKEAYAWFRQHRPLAPGSKLGMFFTDNMLGVGVMNAVVTTVVTLKSLGATYQILPERVATLAALRGRNAFLFGAPVDSDAINRIMEHTPLAVDYEPSVKDAVIRDRESGQILPPLKDADGEFKSAYGLITVLNTRDSERGRLGEVIFSGIGSGGTQAAAEFFASPQSLRKLRERFVREGIHGFPAAYQVVVKCTFSDLLIQGVEYHSHRVLQTK
jgi:hypothetical protein